MTLQYLLIALSLIILFRFIHFLNKTLPYPTKVRQYVGFGLPFFELLAWTGFVTWTIKDVFASGNRVALISLAVLLLIAIVPAFLLFRDFFNGVYLKLQDKVDEGTTIGFDNIQGKIKHAGHFSLDILDVNGNIKSIPYHKFRSKIISKETVNPSLEKISLEFHFQGNNRQNECIEQLKKQLIRAPWVAVSQPILLEGFKDGDNGLVIKAVLYALKKNYAEEIREMVFKEMPQLLIKSGHH
jgi:hypothetical protein